MPSGDYEIRHVKDRKDHVMAFHQLSARAVDVNVKCSLEPLPEKSIASQQVFGVNAANERVLVSLAFRGGKDQARFLRSDVLIARESQGNRRGRRQRVLAASEKRGLDP